MDIDKMFSDLKKKAKVASSTNSLNYLKQKGANIKKQASSPIFHPKIKRKAIKNNLQLKKIIRKRQKQIK